jgi:hypothetical protein
LGTCKFNNGKGYVEVIVKQLKDDSFIQKYNEREIEALRHLAQIADSFGLAENQMNILRFIDSA